MQSHVSKTEVQKLIGKNIVATNKNGSIVTGKLVRISGNRLILQRNSGKEVQTKAIIPLVLFDLLAIGTAPYAGAGYGYGSPYSGVGYGNVNNVYGGYNNVGYNPFFF